MKRLLRRYIEPIALFSVLVFACIADKLWPMFPDKSTAPIMAFPWAALIPVALSLIEKMTAKKPETSSTSTGTTTPTFDPKAAPLIDLLMKQLGTNVNDTVSKDETTNLLESNNDAYKGAQTGLDAKLTASGLGTSPIAAFAQGGLDQARAGSAADILTTKIPQMNRDRAQQVAQNRMNLLQLFKGSTTTGAGTNTGPAPAFDPYAAIAYMYQTGQNNKPATAATAAGSPGSGDGYFDDDHVWHKYGS